MYQPSLDTLQIEETTNQTKSQQIDQFFFVLWWEGKTAVYPGKSLSEPSSEPINSVQIWRPDRESNPGHTGGRQVLSPLHQTLLSPFVNENR